MSISKAFALVSVGLFGVTVAAGGCSSSSSGNGTGDDTGGDSGPAADAKPDTRQPLQDAGTFDTSPGDDSSTASCTSVAVDTDGGNISDLPTYTNLNPDGGTPPCSSGDLTQYMNDCFGSTGSAAACGKWGQGGTGTVDQQMCGACISSNVLIGFDPGEPYLASLNTPACIALTDPSSAGQACAQADLNFEACLGVSCQGCTNNGMGGGNDPQGTLIDTCLMNAESGACTSYGTALNNACADLDDGGAAHGCVLSGSSFTTNFIQIGSLLCGGS